jgi:hypothetical protein
MISKKWNINVLLCKNCDRNVTNVASIFNELYVDDDLVGSFDIVTILNAIECDEKKFGLYYFIERLVGDGGENQIAFAGSVMHYRVTPKEDKETAANKVEDLASTVNGAVFKTHRIKVKTCEFPGYGKYELKVFKYDDEKAKDVERDEEEEAERFYDLDYLTATYPFKVEKK